jgi:hypothetical protein
LDYAKPLGDEQWHNERKVTMNEANDNKMPVDEWLALRKEAATKINAATAEVFWCYGYDADPYEVEPDLPEQMQQVGRQYFACAPGSDVWVCFDDLPAEIAGALWEKHSSKLAFPAGLFGSQPQMADARRGLGDGKIVIESTNEKGSKQ